jgi:hypothetical protein
VAVRATHALAAAATGRFAVVASDASRVHLAPAIGVSACLGQRSSAKAKGLPLDQFIRAQPTASRTSTLSASGPARHPARSATRRSTPHSEHTFPRLGPHAGQALTREAYGWPALPPQAKTPGDLAATAAPSPEL